jgi:hypothetical protein
MDSLKVGTGTERSRSQTENRGTSMLYPCKCSTLGLRMMLVIFTMWVNPGVCKFLLVIYNFATRPQYLLETAGELGGGV